MNTEELAKLTPEQKRVKIAEACSYKLKKRRGVWPDCYDITEPNGAEYGSAPIDYLPDYLGDLNAIHEAEKCLRPHCNDEDIHQSLDAQRYELFLVQVLTDTDPFLGASMGDLWHATAAQRSDAFLLTI